jgi:acyl-coenzyme A thioesterase PaaI-like protein
MSDTLQLDASHCFVCGPSNPVGLQLTFALEERAGQEQVCVASFTPGPHHCGYDDITHGGILYSALDDIMANWMFLQGQRMYTARCEIRYLQPLPVGTRVRLEGRCVSQRRRLAQMTGVAIRADTEQKVAKCTATFITQPD